MYYKQAGSDDLGQAVSEDLTPSQYRAAELGYFGLLRRKGMSPQFIDHNGEDLFAQALYEYIRSIRAGKEIRKPVAWIVLCAWSRTVRVLEQPNWRPRMVSTESVGEISADASPAPEEEFLTEDRYRKVRDAVDRLPEYQRELLSVSYFEGVSIREAARKLDWTPSKAQRAHEAAQRGLQKLLGVETSDELAITAGLAAFLSFGPDGPNRALRAIGGFEAAADAMGHRLHHLGDRGLDLLRRPFSSGPGSAAMRVEVLNGPRGLALGRERHRPLSLVARAGRKVSEFGRRLVTSGAVETAAASEGGTRVVETCKAIAVVCVIGTGAVTGGSAIFGSGQQHRPRSAANPPATPARRKAIDTSGAAASESRSPAVTVPTIPRERKATAQVPDSHSESSKSPSTSETPKTNPAQQRAKRYEYEESAEESTFEASQIAAAEEESRDRNPAPSSSSATGSTLSDSGGGATGTTETAPVSPKVQAEEKQTKTQFQGGLP